MTRQWTLILALVVASMLGGVATAEQPTVGASPFRTAELTSNDFRIQPVNNHHRYRRSRSHYQHRKVYRPYRYRYNYRPYSRSTYPRYYGTPRFGYYDYGRRGGRVKIGPFGVWW